MNRPRNRTRPDIRSSHRVRLCLLGAACIGPAPALGFDVSWGNTNGGTYSVGANWIGGAAPGANDFARFGRTRPGNPQVTYTVGFSTNPSNLGVVIEDDRVTFDLNGHAHLLTSSGGALTVGTTQGFTGRLTITDGAMAATAAAPPNAFIGTNGAPGSLIISTGGQLLGPVLWVGAGGPGTLSIQGGGDFVGKDILVGGLVGGAGAATVTGPGSVALIDGGLGVGALSSGSMNITAGGRVESIRGALAQNPSTTGTVTVDGEGSTWTTSEEIVVGYSGQGAMNITGGGVVESVGVSLAANTGSTATVTIDGLGSEWNNTTDVNVGDDGNANVVITDGGYLGTGSINIARFGGTSTVSVTGPAARLAVGYELTVGGDRDLFDRDGGSAALFIGPEGLVDAAHIYICPNDTVTLQGGLLKVYQLDRLVDSTGQFLFHSGILGARFIEFGIVNQGGTLQPRYFGNTVIDGSYTQQAAATLDVRVGGTDALQIEQLLVSGTASLGGMLELHLINAFIPTPGQSMVILDAGGITGSFANVASGQRVPVDMSGTDGTIAVYYGPGSPFDPTQVVLTEFFRPCAADFNHDNIVDTQDFFDFIDAFFNGDADFNGIDGTDSQDYFDFLSAFFAGC